jgi:2-desacetyl-2-hydroxyethyl bacteriochlorophyllide A dehydrogenase
MRALWLEDKKLEYRSNLPIPDPADSEALIRVQLAGICSTDLELVRGYYPFSGIPGHEFVGEVVTSPKNPTWIGKRVVGEINIACGECATCRSGLHRHCEKRKTLGIHDWNGAFAEYLVLPLSNLHTVPDNLPAESAVFTEPLAAAYEILEQNTFTPGDTVLLIGAGRLGQLIAQVLHAAGCEIEVVVRHSKQSELLEQHNIHTVSAQGLGDKKFDVVIEATGSPDGFGLARRYVRPRGKIILKSTYQGNMDVNLSSIVVDEVTLMGSRCGPFEPALRLLAEGKVDPASLIEAVYPLEQAIQAFTLAAMPGKLKVLIRP